ncbi:MAG: S41 family peptidase [Pseudomonadota bacterium]
MPKPFFTNLSVFPATSARLPLPALALAALLASGALAAAPAAPAVAVRSAAQWQSAAIEDIEAAYRITLENHPGAFDPANPGFVKNLASARENGLALAAKVSDSAGYAAAIARFNVSIHDGHAGALTRLPPEAATPDRWPGFITVWRGDGLVVFASEAGGPPAGARVSACDGVPVQDLIAANVFAFRGRIDEPGHWWTFARSLFLDQGNPFVKPAQRCQFLVDGKVQERALVWTPITEQGSTWRTQTYNGDSLPVGLSEPRAKLFWAAMPTFQPDDKERDAYRAMNEEITTHRQRYLDADALVVDLRQNQGGSSTWSIDFASALWGKGRVERRRNAYFAATKVWWRASSENTGYMGQVVDELIGQKQNESAEWARKTSVGMREALARGEKFYVENDEGALAPQGDPNADVAGDPPPFTKPLYVVVPGQCASACLDALDTFTLFPNTILIGAPSAADSTYMEVRTQKLASGLSYVIIPNKVYVRRPRANGQFYTPQLLVTDLAWSTAAFVNAVEAQLNPPATRAMPAKASH